MEKLSSTLKQLLAEANMSEAELARRTGIAQPMVNRLATGKNKNPKLETLKPITKYFSITFSQLLGEDPLPLQSGEGRFSADSWYEVPCLPLEAVEPYILSQKSDLPLKIVTTNVQVGSQAFAIEIDGNHYEPRFPHQTLLIFEPGTTLKHKDFVLVKNGDRGFQIYQALKDTMKTSLVNLQDGTQEALSAHQTILGVLAQARYDYR